MFNHNSKCHLSEISMSNYGGSLLKHLDFIDSKKFKSHEIGSWRVIMCTNKKI